MRYFHLAAILIFAAIIVIFAAQNFQLAAVFLRISIEIRLAFLVLIIYILGALTGGSLLALLRHFIQGARRHTHAPTS